jgi:hypothetical protein
MLKICLEIKNKCNKNTKNKNNYLKIRDNNKMNRREAREV